MQVAVVFSKVARFDFPKAWPTLFSDLLAKLQVVLVCRPLSKRPVWVLGQAPVVPASMRAAVLPCSTVTPPPLPRTGP